MQVFSIRFHYFICSFSFASHLSLFLKKRRDCGVLGTSIRNCKLSREDGVKESMLTLCPWFIQYFLGKSQGIFKN